MEKRKYIICKVINNKLSKTGKGKIVRYYQGSDSWRGSKKNAQRFEHDEGRNFLNKLKQEHYKQFWVKFYMFYEGWSLNYHLQSLEISKARNNNAFRTP